jgi:hypothetical protein
VAPKILINYRRDDSTDIASRLHDRLAQTFGSYKVFTDVDSIPVGVNFREYLNRQVAACDVMLVVIGPDWLNAKDKAGRRRLDQPDDFVAIEIAAALARDIPVLPVLIERARMPKESELPDKLKPLARHHHARIRNVSFDRDSETLVQRLREVINPRPRDEFIAKYVDPTIEASRGVIVTESIAARKPLNKQLSVADMEGFISEFHRDRAAIPKVRKAKVTAAAREEEKSKVPGATATATAASRPEAQPRSSAAAHSPLLPLVVVALLGIVAFSDFGRSVVNQILSLLGVKLGVGLVPVSIDHKTAEPPPDRVECSVFGPPAVPPDGTALVQVFLHLPEQVESAKFIASAMDVSTTLRGTRSLEVEIKRGARVDISLAVNRSSVDEPVQSVVWQGQPVFCQFLVTIPAGTSGQNFFPIVRVSIDGSLVGCIKFRISSDASAASPQSIPLGDYAHRYENAFVSYATKDRKEVLKRVQMLNAMKIKFFQDVLSLDPGDRWEKKLYEKIHDCDMFLLFWSQAAKDSEWVMREVEYALKRQSQNQEGEPDIVPIILEQNVRPPQSLADVHFNDRIGYLISLMP